MSDSGDFQASARRSAQAASVSNRWWESEGAAPASAPPPPPPPPPMGAPSSPPPAGETFLWNRREQRQLQLELEAARDEIAALHEMLEDLPEIFERKFRQRVQGLVEEQRRLLADNQMLRERLYALTPASPVSPPLALPPRSSFPARGERSRLRRSLRSALGNWLTQAGWPSPPADLSPRDDGQTTAA